MRLRGLRYEQYEETTGVPNVVVDGSPNAATVLTLSHWPGVASPPGCEADSSTQMAFRYLDRRADLHGAADVVTNNHFDEDGVAGVFALVDPELALQRRAQLEDLASAGDFAVCVDRSSARLSMALSTLTDPARTALSLPDDWSKANGVLYRAALELLPSWLEDADRCRDLWADEDAELEAGLQAIASGAVGIEEDRALDLAVVTLPAEGRSQGHRFRDRTSGGVHPIALHGATAMTTILTLDPATGRHAATCRYEGWVQYRSREIRPRRDLRPLADALTEAESHGARWVAAAPSDLSPELRTVPDGPPSSLDPAEVARRVAEHLRTAPPAWDPYAPR